MKKKIIYISAVFFLLLVITLSVSTFNDKLRNDILSNVANIYKLYSNFKIKRYMKTGNFEELSNSISNQIDMSLKFSSRKSALHENIFYNLDLIFKRIIFRDQILLFEKPIKKLLKIDPNIYLANVWMAEIVYLKNYENTEKIKEAFIYIDKAIKLSPARHEAFKTGLKIAIKNKLNNKIQDLCYNYKNFETGGSMPINHYNFFRGNNIKNMILTFPNKNFQEKIYKDGYIAKTIQVYENNSIELNKEIDYEFNFLERKNFNNFSLILSILPGISINVKQVLLIGKDEKKIFNKNDFSLLTKNGFITNDINNLIITSEADENVSFIFNEDLKNIESVMIKLEFKKLKLSNFCN